MNERVKQKLRKLRIGSPSRPDGRSDSSDRRQKPTVPASTTQNSNASPLPRSQSPLRSQSDTPAVDTKPTTVSSSTIWSRAVDEVQQTAVWSKYCEIVGRKQLFSIPATPPKDTSSMSAEQTPEISRLVLQLEDEKKRTQNQSFRSPIDQTLSCVIAVKDAGSALAALNPYASLGWSVLQFMLSAATTSHAIRKACYETLPQVLEWTTRYQVYEQIYSRGDNIKLTKRELETSLQSLYSALLNYQIVCVVTIHSKMSKLSSVLQSKDENPIQQALGDLKQKESQWRKLQPVIDREINDAQFQCLHSLVEGLKSNADVLLSQVSDVHPSVSSEQRLKILNWISPVKYEDAHRHKKRQAMQYTADWLLKHADYLAWNELGTGGGIWLSGFMGSGKSCLAHAVIEDLSSQCLPSDQPDFKLAYYYCDGTDAEKKAEMASAERILCVLVKQLAASEPETLVSRDLLEVYEKQSHKSEGLTKTQCLDLMTSIASSVTELRVVIDGLDECEATVQRELIKTLKALFERLMHGVKFFISCRPHLKDMLEGLITWTINVPEHNREAIELMIRTSVNEAAKSGDLKHSYYRGTERLEMLVIDTLIDNAGGMYRWVDMALTFLHRPPVDFWEMKDRLQRLPQLTDLYQLYDQIWADNMKSLSSKSREVVETAMLFVIYGVKYEGQSVRTDHRHILEACTVVRTGKIGLDYFVSDIIALCRGFLIQPEVTQRVKRCRIGKYSELIQVPHVSVTDWLTTVHAERFGTHAGHFILGKLCLEIFVHNESFAEYNADVGNSVVLYAANAWPLHLRALHDIGKNICQLGGLTVVLDSFLRGSPTPPAFLRWDTWLKTATSRGLFGDWFLDVEEQTAEILCIHPPSNAFACLYFNFHRDEIFASEYAVSRKLMLDARVHVGENNQTEQQMTGIGFAAMVGQHGAIRWLISQGLTPCHQTPIGWNAGHQLLCMDREVRRLYTPRMHEALEVLVQEGLDLTAEDNAGRTCFDIAVKYRTMSPEVLEVFLAHSYPIFRPFNFRPSISSNHFFVPVDLEDSEEGKVEMKKEDVKEHGEENSQMSALDYAILDNAAFGQDATLALIPPFFKNHTDRTMRSKWLQLAVENGDASAVKAMVDHGASPLDPDAEGLLPLWHAVEILCSTRDFLLGGVVDVLAPLTLGQAVGYKLPSSDCPLSQVVSCPVETVRLFVEHVANPVTEPGLWGNNLITGALRYNYPSEAERVGRYLYSMGYRDEKPGGRYKKLRISIETGEEFDPYDDDLSLVSDMADEEGEASEQEDG